MSSFDVKLQNKQIKVTIKKEEENDCVYLLKKYTDIKNLNSLFPEFPLQKYYEILDNMELLKNDFN